MQMSKFINIPALFLMFFAMSACCSIPVTYKGRVIDADTKEPIEGATIYVTWPKERGSLMGPTACTDYNKETVTDKDGYWKITGPNGCETAVWNNILTLIIPFCYYQEPNIHEVKEGYCVDFMAFAYTGKPKGIILIKRLSTGIERKEFYKKYGDNLIPVIVLDHPEKRITELDFPFDYIGYENQIITINRELEPYPFRKFTIVGLKKSQKKKCNDYN